jgi:biopolymer transport protein ExbD
MKLREKIRTEAEIPTASMADIAFLLIIFFMVTTIFSAEKGLQIVLPEKGGEVKVKKGNVATIKIDAEGLVTINDEPIEVHQMRATVQQMLSENDSLAFSLKTHPEAKYWNLIDVFDELKMGDAERVSFAN